MEDIINQWTIWLHEAVLRFDYKKWFEFSTYANWWINQSINRYVKDNNRTIRVPLHAIDKLQLVLNIKKKLIQNWEKVTISSIASRLDLTKSEVSDILNIPYATESVVSSWDKDDDVFDLVENYSTQEWSLSDQEVLLDKKIFSFDSKLFEEVLDWLTEREKEIIIKRYKFDLSLEEVWDTLYDPISIERVRQIQLKAERKIRRNIEKLDLDQYV
jgi:RNA polymerase primary sigma factor